MTEDQSNKIYIVLQALKNDKRLKFVGGSPLRVVEAIRFINEHYDQRISTRDVAKHVRMELTAFCRLFREKTDMRCIDYINLVTYVQQQIWLTY